MGNSDFRATVLVGLCVLGAVLTIGLVAQALDTAVGLWVTEALFLGVSWVLLANLERPPATYVGLALPSAWPLVFGLAVGAANFAALVVPIQALMHAILPKWLLDLDSSAQLLEGHRPWELTALVLGVTVAAPVCEEFFFRGVVLRGFLKLGPTWAILISATIFALAHFNPPNFAALFALGLLLGVLYVRSRSIWPGVAAHAANNVVSVLVFFAAGPAHADDAPEAADVLAFGAVGGLLLLALFTLAGRFPRLLGGAPEQPLPPPTGSGTA